MHKNGGSTGAPQHRHVALSRSLTSLFPPAAAAAALQQEVQSRQMQEDLTALQRSNKALHNKLRQEENSRVSSAISRGLTVPYGRLPQPARGRMAVGIDIGAPGSGGRPRSRSVSRDKAGQDDSYHYATARSLVEAASTARPSTAPAPSSAPVMDASVQSRIINAEASAAALRAENEALRRQMAGASAAAAASPAPANGSTVAVPRGDLIELERQLKDKASQVLLLKSRYEALEGRSASERELYDRAVAALEAQNVQIRETRTALAAAENDISSLKSRLRGSEDMDGELRSAREEIRRLERALTDLCESPFIAEKSDASSKRERLEGAEKELIGLREQVVHLQHTVRSQHSELTVVRREKKELTEAAERLKEEADKARVAADMAVRSNAMLRERLALYSGVVGGPEAMVGGAGTSFGLGASIGGAGPLAVPADELQRALTLVRKRLDTPGTVESGSPEDAAADSLPSLRRKTQTLQLALVSTQRELERGEAMLRAQTTIAADLGAEVAELNERLSGEGGTLRRRLEDTETLAERRLQRVQLLEAQVRQLLERLRDVQAARKSTREAAASSAAHATRASKGASAPARPVRRASGAGMPHGSPHDDDDGSTVISELSGGDGEEVEAAARDARDALDDDSGELSATSLLDVGPGEAAIEVYVVEASLEPGLLGRHDTTFAMLDFYDFEAQSSPMASGGAPYYNFAASYRVVADPFFLRDGASEGKGVRIEVHQARGSAFVLVARAILPLRRLLLTPSTRVKYAALPLVAADGRVVGSIKAELRVGAPLSPFWDAYCKVRPAEGAALTAAMRTREELGEVEGLMPTAASSAPSTGRGASASSSSAANELIVTVVAASELRPGARTSRTVVSYILPTPGSLAATTPAADASASPVYSDARTFPLITDGRTLDALRSSPLLFTLREAPGRGGAEGAILGTAAVSLADVAGGESIEGVYDMADARGGIAGRLQVRLSWARPLTLAGEGAGEGGPTMARSAVQALAGIVDRDGSGVKPALLLSLLSRTEAEGRALTVCREGASAGKGRQGSRWSDALRAAADATGRANGGMTPREVHAALAAPAVSAPLDEVSVGEGLGPLTRSGLLPVSEVVDVLMPLAPAAAAALARARALLAARGSAGGEPRLVAFTAALTEAAAAEARAASSGAAGSGLAGTLSASDARVSRSGLASALKMAGVVVVEDSSLGREARDAFDFRADPSRPIHGAEEAELLLQPATVTTAAMGTLAARRGSGSESSATGSLPAKALRFPDAAVPRTPFASSVTGKDGAAGIVVAVPTLMRLSPALRAALPLPGSQLYLTVAFPSRVPAASTCGPVLIRLQGMLESGSSVTFTPVAGAPGAGVAYGVSTSEFLCCPSLTSSRRLSPATPLSQLSPPARALPSRRTLRRPLALRPRPRTLTSPSPSPPPRAVRACLPAPFTACMTCWSREGTWRGRTCPWLRRAHLQAQRRAQRWASCACPSPASRWPRRSLKRGADRSASTTCPALSSGY